MFGKYQTKILFGLFLLLSVFIFVSAYDAATTHAGLSQEIVAYYQAVTGKSLSKENTDAIISGSILEDEPSSRVTRHFYDPVHNVGLLSQWESSKVWMNDSTNEFAWDKGIQAYAKGDTKKAFEILGHALHFIEDASVPDHTRNDAHASLGLSGFYSNSPYENWTQQNKDKSTMKGMGLALAQKERVIPSFSSPEDALHTMAMFSNNNFFSKDTISAKEFSLPKKDNADGDYVYGFVNGKKYKLALIKTENLGLTRSLLLLTDDDSSVMSDYFSILGPEAIKNGAGMLDLFIKQGEAAKKELEKAKLPKETPPAAPTNPATSPDSPTPPADGFLDTLQKGLKVVPDYLKTFFQSGEEIARSLAAINQSLTSAEKKGTQAAITSALEPLRPTGTTELVINQNLEQSAPVLPTADAAAERIVQLNQAAQKLEEIRQSLESFKAAHGGADVIVLTSNTGGSGGGGGGAAPATQETTDTTQTDSASTTPRTTDGADTTAPVFSVAASDCTFATSTECTATYSTTTLSWASKDTDIAFWNLDLAGNVSTTTATSTEITLTAGATTTVALSATDISGNTSATTTLSIFYPTQIIPQDPTEPIILSEDTTYDRYSVHEFDTDLIIPQGIILTIGQASTLSFAPGKGLYVYGNLIINQNYDGWEGGNSDVVFDRKGDSGYWSGISFASTTDATAIYRMSVYHSEGVVFDEVRSDIGIENIFVADGDGVGVLVKNNSNIFLGGVGTENISGDGIAIVDSNVYLKYTDSYNSDTCLSAERSTVKLRNGHFERCITGMSFVDSAIDAQTFLFVDGNVIGVSSSNSTGKFRQSSIAENSAFGFFIENGTFDAKDMWWGSETGPFNPDTNPEGEGNAVSNEVLFDPWLEQFGIFQI